MRSRTIRWSRPEPAGYLVNGVLHLLVAALGLQVAFGDKGAEADPKGAMRLVSDTPVGGLVLVAIVAGFVLLAVWQVSEGIRSRKAADRVKAVGKTLVYLVLAWGAVTILLGGGTSGPAQAKDATATVMSLPFGQALVGACGLAVIGVGAFHIHKGWTEGFRDDLETSPGSLLITVARIGYIAKGVALMALGSGLVTAAALHDPSRSRGLDGALSDLVAPPVRAGTGGADLEWLRRVRRLLLRQGPPREGLSAPVRVGDGSLLGPPENGLSKEPSPTRSRSAVEEGGDLSPPPPPLRPPTFAPQPYPSTQSPAAARWPQGRAAGQGPQTFTPAPRAL